MTKVDDVARGLNTVGLAAWFGGSLMGAVAVSGADREHGGGGVSVEDHVWKRWSPVQTAAIGAHLLGAAQLARTNKGRLAGQSGVGRVAIFKVACTAGALGATVYASQLGRQVQIESRRRIDVPADGEGSGARPDPAAETRRRLRAVQAVVPVLTGAMLIADARLGEQQRPVEVLRGAATRVLPDSVGSLGDLLPSGAALGAVAGVARRLPEVARQVSDVTERLPDVPDALPDALRSVPDAARQLPEVARQLRGAS